MRRNVFTTYDPNLPLGKKFVAVHVQNEDPLYFLVEVKAKVCELFVQISKFLNLLEPELFGLAIKSSDTFIFLDPLEKLSKYAPKPWKTQNNGMDNDGSPLFNVYFRVQFYVDSYLFISDKVAKYYYYHQLRENVLRYDQSMCEERAFLLASFALQADYGNYNAKLHKTRYFDPSHYFPGWVIEELGIDYIQRHLPSLHCDHKGMSKSEAQSMFIREASDPMAAHNFHLYKMAMNPSQKKSHSQTETWLAITITGLMIYAAEPLSQPPLPPLPPPPSVHHHYPPVPGGRRLKTRISFFPWSDIGKLSFDKKKFEIRSIGPQSRKFIYYTGSEELARFLLWFSRACHQFHLMVLPKMREMLKREAEINRRKYRETCVSIGNNSHNHHNYHHHHHHSSAIAVPGSSSSRTTSSSDGTGTGSDMIICNSGTSSSQSNHAITSVTSSSGNSSNNTSKSVSPFDTSTHTSMIQSNGKGVRGHHHHLSTTTTSDLDISTTSSMCCGSSNAGGNRHHHHLHHHLMMDDDQPQRVSVISNASSNTTSGIASDRRDDCLLMMMGGEDDSDQCPDVDDLDASSDLLMSLNSHHHHHHHGHHHRHPNRAIHTTLSGCSPQPQPVVVSMESLALSEPIIMQDHHKSPYHPYRQSSSINNHKYVQGQATNSSSMIEPSSTNLKKHSISVSNIMITAVDQSPSTATTSNNNAGVSSDSSSPVKATIVKTEPESESRPVPEATEVLVNGPESKLCLNINDSGSSPDAEDQDQDDDDSSDDEDDDNCSNANDSILFDHRGSGSSHGKKRNGGASKSNVTVLSTILKPEAERLLKQGLDVVDGSCNDNTIDSLELAELKEFEQQEKEKLILNSLIDNIPPPPSMISHNDDDSDSDSSSSSSSSSSDSESDCEDEQQAPSQNPARKSSPNPTSGSTGGKPANHYSPLAQERRLHNQKNSSSPKTTTATPTTTNNNNSSSTPVRMRSSSASVQQTPTTNTLSSGPFKPSTNPIYANVPVSKPYNYHHYQTGFPPTVPLRPYPSLNSVPTSTPTTQHHYPHRTGMRIGVSSLSRPLASANQKQHQQMLLHGGCVHSQQNIPQMMMGPACLLNAPPPSTNLLSSAAGSEPNLYFGGVANYPGNLSYQQSQQMPNNKSDSVYDCRRIGGCGDESINKTSNTTTTTSKQSPASKPATHTPASTTFRQFIKNQLGGESPPQSIDKPLTITTKNLHHHQQHNATVPTNMITPPPSADYHKKNHHLQPPTSTSSLEQLSLCSSTGSNCSNSSSPSPTSQSQQPQSNGNNGISCKLISTKKSKESRLKELRQRTSDLNLPLINALFNDSSLTLSDRFLDNDQPLKSQSMQHLTPPPATGVYGPGGVQPNHHKSGSSLNSSSGCCSTSSSTSSTPSRASPATVERSCTFRVDEAIAKSALRTKSSQHDANNNDQSEPLTTTNTNRPISWHMGQQQPQPSIQTSKITKVVRSGAGSNYGQATPSFHHNPYVVGHRTTTLIHQ